MPENDSSEEQSVEQVMEAANILRLDADAMRTVPRVYANYCQCTIENDQVCLIFSQRQTTQVPGHEPTTIAFPQSIVYMTLGQFMKTAALFTRQSKMVINSLETLEGDQLKEQLFGSQDNR